MGALVKRLYTSFSKSLSSSTRPEFIALMKKARSLKNAPGSPKSKRTEMLSIDAQIHKVLGIGGYARYRVLQNITRGLKRGTTVSPSALSRLKNEVESSRL